MSLKSKCCDAYRILCLLGSTPHWDGKKATINVMATPHRLEYCDKCGALLTEDSDNKFPKTLNEFQDGAK